MPTWLLISLVASVVLTLAVNVLPRLFPGLGASAERRFVDQARRAASGKPAVRVIFPWKAMIVISVLATVALNVLV